MPKMISKIPRTTMREAFGADSENILKVAMKMCKDPLNPSLDQADVAEYLCNHLDDSDVQQMVNTMLKAQKKMEKERKYMGSIDFSSLPVLKKSIFVIQIESEGYGMPDEALIERRHSAGSGGAQPAQKFSMTCSNRFEVEKGSSLPSTTLPRCWAEFTEWPDSKQVEDFICQALTQPFPPLKPCLPSFLMISYKLKPYEASLKPFLDSFPAPFKWFFAPQTLETGAEEYFHRKALLESEKYMQLALQTKAEGNEAFAAKDGLASIAAYQEAIRLVGKALFKTDSDEKANQMRNFGAVCYANCSAARMLPGKGMDVRKALEDAQSAIEFDKSYAKGYVRLSKAHEVLGDQSQAEEAIAKALRLPQLENHEGLVDQLIKLQTDGKGLPEKRKAFTKWSRKIFGQGESADRMRNVGGLWRKRCEAHKKLFEASK